MLFIRRTPYEPLENWTRSAVLRCDLNIEQTARPNGAGKMNLGRNRINAISLVRPAAGRIWAGMLLIFLILLGTAGFADDEGLKSREEQQLVLGFMNDVFSDVNVADALAATKVWATELKSKKE